MRFISENKISGVFRDMLRAILELTESEFGLIAEVLYQENGVPCIRTHAITDFTWNEDLRHFYGSGTTGGVELYQQQTLFGAVINHAEKIISNDPQSDPRHGELPPGHPCNPQFSRSTPVPRQRIIRHDLHCKPDGWL